VVVVVEAAEQEQEEQEEQEQEQEEKGRTRDGEKLQEKECKRIPNLGSITHARSNWRGGHT
jgi:hypothetical protein